MSPAPTDIPATAGDPDATNILVTAGDPDATELAVITAVLHRRAAVSAATRAHTGPPRVPAWLRAARIEGVGRARISSPADLQAPGAG